MSELAAVPDVETPAPVAKNRARLMIDFLSPEDVLEFVSKLRLAGHLPDAAKVYQSDALDFQARKIQGVGRKHTFILRNPDESRKELKFVTKKVLAVE
jgi:hypothetical protein